jgi:hypothetical protein
MTTMKNKTPLVEAFALMPQVFTSSEFARVARDRGMTTEDIARGHCATFLHRLCIKEQKSRTWFKKNKPVEQKKLELIVDVPKKESTKSEDMPDSYHIEILKSRGYNISKLIQF